MSDGKLCIYCGRNESVHEGAGDPSEDKLIVEGYKISVLECVDEYGFDDGEEECQND